MIIKKKINNIKKDNLKRKNFLKNEIKRIVYKSIIQNLHVKPYIRSLILKKFEKFSKKSFLSYQTNNLCLKSGRFKGVLKQTNICRHEMKKLGLKCSLQNIKIKAW